jgi:hypothetical protein
MEIETGRLRITCVKRLNNFTLNRREVVVETAAATRKTKSRGRVRGKNGREGGISINGSSDTTSPDETPDRKPL